jgi:hypothetical protein
MEILSLLLKRKRLLLIFIPVFLVFISILLNQLSYRPEPQNSETQITPTRFIQTISDIPSEATPTAAVQPPDQAAQPPVEYKTDAIERMMEKLMNKVPLSEADEKVKQNILSGINYESAILQKSDGYQVEYVSPPGQFMVEIQTRDIARVKKEVKDLFLLQGFSEQAICDLPVIFYINWDLAQQMRSLRIKFSPLAEGC